MDTAEMKREKEKNLMKNTTRQSRRHLDLSMNRVRSFASIRERLTAFRKNFGFGDGKWKR